MDEPRLTIADAERMAKRAVAAAAKKAKAKLDENGYPGLGDAMAKVIRKAGSKALAKEVKDAKSNRAGDDADRADQ